MTTIYVFCYGSNLLLSRIKARCPSVHLMGVGYINGHALKFHMQSTDGSGKADAYQTDHTEDVVWGTLIGISKADKIILDGHEELGSAYNEKQVTVWLREGLQTTAWVYVASKNRIKAHLKPYCWYHRYVLKGAKENNLPTEYLKAIEAVGCDVDRDEQRREKNLI
ncbi:AIG2-like family protein [Saccharicrinis carchari]|uniref:AIG2-like family protein n=1 Tax=Saccharicrinis carchari TaxID=1168039 RepID=A0A521CKZ9_SACCC|nr:gamma-glutamylcyclotransferase family protein [Saccharicrinis carchari]SMO59360.1 AIG2-like family protein [Saccharicrinis carchari]